MTWEILIGIFALTSALIPIFNIVIKVNKTLCSLELVELLRHASKARGEADVRSRRDFAQNDT